MATDPVCGMQVDEASPSGTAVYGGKPYYFCSAHCRAKFDQDPAAYVGQDRAQEPGPSRPHDHNHDAYAPVARKEMKPPPGKGVATYTCPMHPEVRQSGPGACPKCGMDLEPEVPVAAAVE